MTLNSERLLTLASFIEAGDLPFDYSLDHCFFGQAVACWPDDLQPASLFSEAANFLGLEYIRAPWSHQNAIHAFCRWPTELHHTTPAKLRALAVHNLRHWAHIGKVQWVDLSNNPLPDPWAERTA